MSNRNDINLRGAIPETPQMCRDAVLQAVSTYREERTMKRTYKVALIAAIICILMCGAAFAIVQYYSVREYIADGNTSTAFEEAVVPVEKTVESNGLSITLGDAVFDGRDLAFTLDIVPQENAEPVYVYPSLAAVHDGKPLETYYYGFDFSYGTGAIIPSLNQDEPLASSRRGITVKMLQPISSGTVDWTYTLKIYKPTGKLVEIDDEAIWNDNSARDWNEHYRSLHENGDIGVFAGNSIGDYLRAICPEDDLTEAKRAENSGLFELADTIEFEFSTEVSDGNNLVSETVHVFDGYTVTVKSITRSFMQVNYELEAMYDEPQPNEHDLNQSYVLTDQDGSVMPWRSSGWSLAEDGKTCAVYGSVERITDAPLTEITFNLSDTPTLNQITEGAPSFTIQIEP